MSIPLSVLDLSPVRAGVAPSAAVRESAALAQAAERLGFARYWAAEHHTMQSIAASAPGVLLAHVAARTERIRVGAGGIMVPNHAPLHVVEVFRTLEALYPGRVDLGLGRAPGTDPVTSTALRRSDDPEVNHLLAELLAFEQGGFPADHPYAALTPMPSDVRVGQLWMLGSTLAGASIAAQLGVRYAFAGHFAMAQAEEAIALYKRAFRPSETLAEPHAMLAVTAVCGESDAHAERLAAPIKLAMVRVRTGKRAPIASEDEALAYRFSPHEQAIAESALAGAAIGGPERVGQALGALVARTGADELMLSALLPDLQTRIASLARIAAAIAPNDGAPV